jgi:cytoskeleton protein RodZ
VNEEMFQNQDSPVNGPGKLLQDAREDKNLRPEDVAYELRLTPSQVLSLEENDYSNMPEETYVRGYLRNYARLVGVAENEILVSFARLTRGSETKTQVALPVSEENLDKSNKSIHWLAVGIVFAVVILSAVWVLKPHDKQAVKEDKAETLVVAEKPVSTGVPVGASTLNLSKPAEVTVVADESSPVSGETMQPAPESASEAESENGPATIPADPSLSDSSLELGVAVVSPETGSIQSELSEPAVATSETSIDPVITSDGTLFISYSKDSWTDVRDANGKKLLYRTVKKGEKVALAGKLPMSLFFGFAQGVKVTFNGVDVDVSAHTRGVFARFTVGEAVNP